MQNAAYPPQYNAGAQPVPMPEQVGYYAAPAMLGGPVPGRPSYVLPQAPSVGSWPLPPATTQMVPGMAPPPAPANEEPTKVVRAKGVARARWNRDEEERLKKFIINAPFDGSISKTYINEGTLINPGMILGSFISDSNFELTVNIPSKYADFVLINDKVEITFNNKKISGLIKRINKNIDELSQTVSIHIEFTNRDLKDGLYVNTKIPLNLNSEGFSVSRSILINDSFVYVAENNNVVGIRNVKPIYYDEDSVIISGLKDGERIISSYIPGIYKGMKIKISD